MSTTLQPHPFVTAILDCPDPMQIKDLACAITMDETFIGKAIRAGHLTACMMRGSGMGRKMRYRITRSNALLWIWRNELGDRSMMRAALELHCPALLTRITAEPATPEACATGAHKQPARRVAAAQRQTAPTGQLDLFDSAAHLPLTPALIGAR